MKSKQGRSAWKEQRDSLREANKQGDKRPAYHFTPLYKGEMWHLRGLSNGAFRAYMVLRLHADECGEVFISLKKLAKWLKRSVKSTWLYVRELEQARVIAGSYRGNRVKHYFLLTLPVNLQGLNEGEDSQNQHPESAHRQELKHPEEVTAAITTIKKQLSLSRN